MTSLVGHFWRAKIRSSKFFVDDGSFVRSCFIMSTLYLLSFFINQRQTSRDSIFRTAPRLKQRSLRSSSISVTIDQVHKRTYRNNHGHVSFDIPRPREAEMRQATRQNRSDLPGHYQVILVCDIRYISHDLSRRSRTSSAAR